MLRKALIASSLLVLSTSVVAEGGYIGLSAGQTDIGEDGFDKGTSVAITGGYKFNENFAIESIGKTNALFVTTLPYPSGVRQCRIATEAAANYYK